jgi:hypothetical protein
MPEENLNPFVYKNIRLRALRQDGVTLTVQGETESAEPSVTIIVENDRLTTRPIKVDAKINREIRKAIEWIKETRCRNPSRMLSSKYVGKTPNPASS